VPNNRCIISIAAAALLTDRAVAKQSALAQRRLSYARTDCTNVVCPRVAWLVARAPVFIPTIGLHAEHPLMSRTAQSGTPKRRESPQNEVIHITDDVLQWPSSINHVSILDSLHRRQVSLALPNEAVCMLARQHEAIMRRSYLFCATAGPTGLLHCRSNRSAPIRVS
jgi:hypothetical protein